MSANELEFRLPPERNYGPIWVKMYLDQRVSTHDMVVYASAQSFGEKCTAGKEAMAKRCKCSRRQVQKSLKVLEDLGYIKRGPIKKLGNF